MGKAFDVASIQVNVEKLLKYAAFEPEQRFWLQTTSPDLNAVFGSREAGIPYGKIYELSGQEHGGKTVIGNILMGLAIQDGAMGIYGDIEDSRDAAWATKLGVDWTKVIAVYPKLIVPLAKDGKATSKKEPILQSGEVLFDEIETFMRVLHNKGCEKMFVLVDSVANIQTGMQQLAGNTGRNMRTQNDRAMMLAQALPKWAGLAANYNAIIFFLNQLRNNPGVMFGSPETTPGGRALRHNAAIRAKVRRVKNGRMHTGSGKNKHIVGIRSMITNFKNKAGQGSVEGERCGMQVRWDSDVASIEFLPAEELETDEET